MQRLRSSKKGAPHNHHFLRSRFVFRQHSFPWKPHSRSNGFRRYRYTPIRYRAFKIDYSRRKTVAVTTRSSTHYSETTKVDPSRIPIIRAEIVGVAACQAGSVPINVERDDMGPEPNPTEVCFTLSYFLNII
jgi:hypothetical protein